MNIRKSIALSTLAVLLSGGVAFAQDHHDDHGNQANHGNQNHYVKHSEWKKGYHMKSADWNRGERIDYRQYHLNRPPAGYEWRSVDGNYVMGAISTGVIGSVVVGVNIR